MRLIQGGLPEPGEGVIVNGREATVIHSGFRTHVFEGDVSVRFEDGNLDLVPVEKIERQLTCRYDRHGRTRSGRS